MSLVQLDDLVYTYPPDKKKNFQTYISAKEEFIQTASSTTEPIPERGGLFKHQEYLLRFMRQYDNQLVIWRTGTGKTCGVTSVTEYYKNLASSLEQYRQESPYTRAYVLVKGKSLVQEFKFQLLCKCTNEDYITPQILNSKTSTQRKTNITNSIKRFYTVKTYGSFIKDVVNLSDDRLIEQYSNSIFIIDEIHNLKGEAPIKDKDEDEDEDEELSEDEDALLTLLGKTGKKKKKAQFLKIVYSNLWRLFHVVKARKVMLLSATPMVNDSSEIGPILNLILPENYQLPKKVDYSKITLEQFEPFARGYISYVRELDTGAIPEYQGEKVDSEYDIGGRELKSQMVIYASLMSELQNKTYNRTVKNPESFVSTKTKSKVVKSSKPRPGAFSILQRQSANFVFPDGTTGKGGFNNPKYVIEVKKRISYKVGPELKPWLENIDYMKQLSSKFANIVQTSKDTPGNSWCYCHFVRGSGAILLGLCFEGQGFERFQESSSIFSAISGSSLPPVCSSETRDPNRVPRIKKKLRYVLLTGDISDSDTAVLLETFNSYENRHGEYIKAIIGSPVSRDGLNLANVLQIHLSGPGWNRASTYQAESRAIRSTSHVDLIEEEKERLINEGLDPNTATVTIRVYQHASLNEEGKSIDLSMYLFSEEKDIEIKRILRMMKQVATDCQIHYNRNVRPADVDGSATCDYDVCEYKCFDPTPRELGMPIDYSSYDVLYSRDIIVKIKLDIKNIFRQVFTLSISELYNVLSEYRTRFVDEAVTDIIIKKEVIVDRYGYNSYLREDKGSLFLRRDFPLSTIESDKGYSISEYTKTLIGIQTMTINNLISILEISEQSEIIKELGEMGADTKEFNEKLDELNLENKVAVLENAIYFLFVNNIDTAESRKIIEKYQNYVYQIEEPVEPLEISAEALENVGKGRGRKPRPGTKFKLTPKVLKRVLTAIDTGKKGNTVYIHSLYDLEKGLTKYETTAKVTKVGERIRILKPEEGLGWRDLNKYELPIYQLLISREKEDVQDIYSEHPVYGLILKDGEFRIRKQKVGSKQIKDKRKKTRGKVCKTWDKVELVDIMFDLGIVYPRNIKINKTRNDIIEYLSDDINIDILDNLSDDKLEYFYKWYSSGMNRVQICKEISAFMSKNDLLFVAN